MPHHGTSMAALIAGTGAGDGIRGLAPGADILPVDITGPRGAMDYQKLPQAIDYAVARGADIINISSATPDTDVLPVKRTQAAVDRAHRAGVLLFAAAGNDGSEAFVENYPAMLPGVTSVGATDKSGRQAPYSTSGPHLALAAPGTGITLLDKEGGYTTGPGGTSSASALTAAAAALVWAKHPSWNHNQVLRSLLSTADGPGGAPDERVGHGTIRPHRVVLEDAGDPGDPGEHPTDAGYFAPTETAATSADGHDRAVLVLAGGLSAALLLAAVAAVRLRRRRRRATGVDAA